MTLAASQKMLLSILLTLAQDEWPEVAQPCTAYLRSASEASTSEPSQANGKAAAPQVLDPEVVSCLCMELLSGLHPSLQRGEQQGALHAQRLATSLQVEKGIGIQLRLLAC